MSDAQDVDRLLAGWLAFIAAFIVGLSLIFVAGAYAQDGHTHEGAVGRFYQSWMMPDAPKTSCCSNQDCEPVPSRFVNNRWEAQRPNGLWVAVPPNKVEQNRDSPDGRSHLCGRPGPVGEFYVFCFVRGQGS